MQYDRRYGADSDCDQTCNIERWYPLVSFIGVVASIIGLLWAGIVLYRWLHRSQLAEAELLNNAQNNFEYYFREWRATEYTSKHMYLIPFEDFKVIGRFKPTFKGLKTHEQNFLLVCATKHGLWGDWLPTDAEAADIIAALSTLLNGRAGWRPKWRAAYLIQRYNKHLDHSWVKKLPAQLRLDSEVLEAIATISRHDCIHYLERTSQMKNSHLRDNAFVVLEEIKAYTEDAVLLKYPNPKRS